MTVTMTPKNGTDIVVTFVHPAGGTVVAWVRPDEDAWDRLHTILQRVPHQWPLRGWRIAPDRPATVIYVTQGRAYCATCGTVRTYVSAAEAELWCECGALTVPACGDEV